jgi:hypothetical protein
VLLKLIVKTWIEIKKKIKFWFHGGHVIMNFKPKFLKIVSTIPIQSFAVRKKL